MVQMQGGGAQGAALTDISGYRSDGGGLGQDQGLSSQLMRVMMAKLPLLSAPGSVVENTLYYDTNSSSVTAVEMQATFAKDRIAFNNFTSGATPSAYIPSVYFAGTVFWVVSLATAVTWDNANQGFFLPHGWGFRFIRNVLLYMGASNISQIQISGETNYMLAMACCETDVKRSMVMTGAGRFLAAGGASGAGNTNWSGCANSPLAEPLITNGAGSLIFTQKTYGDFYNTTSFAADLNFYNPALAQAVVPIRLPWTSMAVLDKRLSLDTRLTTQPIQIALETRPMGDVMAVFDGGAAAGTMLGKFTSFKYSTLQLWQEELSDKSLSVRNELLANPAFNVGLPFQYAQSIPFKVPTSTDTGKTTDRFDMNITSIINADLTSMVFIVVSDYKSSITSSGPNGDFMPLFGELLYDLELLLNGQRFFNFDQDCYNYVTMAKQLDTTQPLHYAMRKTSVGGTATGVNMRGNVYELNFSRLRSIVSEANMQNTARFTNQTFQLRFRIDRQVNWSALSAANPTGVAPDLTYPLKQGFTLHMCYLYNGVFLIGGDGGTTKLVTN